MTAAPRLLQMPKQEGPEIWIRMPPRQRPKCWDNIEDLWYILKETFMVTCWPAFFWKKTTKEVVFGMGLEKVPTWKCLHAHKKLGLFLSVCVDDKTTGEASAVCAQIVLKFLYSQELDDQIYCGQFTLGHAMEQSLWQKVANVDKLLQSKQGITDNSVMWEVKLKIAKLGVFQDASSAGDL